MCSLAKRLNGKKKGDLKFQPSTIRNNLKPIKLLCEMNDLTYIDNITLVITRLLGITKSKVVCSCDSTQRGDDSNPIRYFLVFCPIVYDSTKIFGVLHKHYKVRMRRTWR
jgi:hypothetical protein